MAVATPVLERNDSAEKNFGTALETADELHNSKIKENYARLINPDFKKEEAEKSAAPVYEQPVYEQSFEVQKNAYSAAPEKPYLIEGARADADIFRADSPINRKFVQPEQVAQAESDDEENEDLRPTRTTIQYKTSDVKSTVEEGVIANNDAEKRTGLSKRDKIIIAVVVSVIVALFVLIIVNSAIISGLNNDLNSLQSSLTNVKAAYAGVSDEITSFQQGIAETVAQFARDNGMIK